MATFSKKLMGKEVGDAKVYATPHTMTGKVVKATDNPGSGPDHSDANTVNMSVGNINRRPQPATKTTGIKMRGAGAATKGFMSRGPLA
jgi:hypothetical protein